MSTPQKSHFFAHLARMKLINRWPLMRNVRTENVQEHSLQVAMVAHSLALIRNKYFNGSVNPYKIATQAMFHDVSEVLTGDYFEFLKSVNFEVISNFYTRLHSPSKLAG
ncbi:putative alpha helix protein [Paraglaciecola sp. T6c]|nr:putative alpha helix protein [Paraglaciecola sp. T6c]